MNEDDFLYVGTELHYLNGQAFEGIDNIIINKALPRYEEE
jgi:hypothetical protein